MPTNKINLDKVASEYVVKNYDKFFSDDMFLSSFSSLLIELSQVHGQPVAWLVGQALSYLMKFNKSFMEVLVQSKLRMNWMQKWQPYVG